MFKYMTVEDCIRSNGERHLERAIAYISAGYPDHFADGSLRKAKRNFYEANLIYYLKHRHDLIIESNKFLDNMFDNIMKG